MALPIPCKDVWFERFPTPLQESTSTDPNGQNAGYREIGGRAGIFVRTTTTTRPIARKIVTIGASGGDRAAGGRNSK